MTFPCSLIFVYRFSCFSQVPPSISPYSCFSQVPCPISHVFVLQPSTLLYRIGPSHVPCVIYFSNDYTVSLESNCPCRFSYSGGIYISKLVCCNNMMATSAFNSDRLHHSTHEQRGSNSYQPFLILLVCSVDITCLP